MGLSKFKNESLAGYHGPYNSNWPGPEPQSLVFEFLKWKTNPPSHKATEGRHGEWSADLQKSAPHFAI